MKLSALTFLFAILFSGLWSGSETHGHNPPISPQIKLAWAYTQGQYNHPTNVKMAMGFLQDAAYLGIMKIYKINSTLNSLNDITNISSPWIIRLG